MDLYICEIAPLWPFTLHETFLPQSVVHIHSLFSFRFPPSQHDARTCPPQPHPDGASLRRVRRALDLRPRSVMRLRDTAVITPDADRVSKQETPQTGFPNRIIRYSELPSSLCWSEITESLEPSISYPRYSDLGLQPFLS